MHPENHATSVLRQPTIGEQLMAEKARKEAMETAYIKRNTNRGLDLVVDSELKAKVM